MYDDSLHWALYVCTSFADCMEFCSHSSVKKIKQNVCQQIYSEIIGASGIQTLDRRSKNMWL